MPPALGVTHSLTPRPGHHSGLGIVLRVSQLEVIVRMWFPLECGDIYFRKTFYCQNLLRVTTKIGRGEMCKLFNDYIPLNITDFSISMLKKKKSTVLQVVGDVCSIHHN